MIEGLETFVVYLSSPHGAELIKPFQAIVAINDIIQDGKLSTAVLSGPPSLLLNTCMQQEASPSEVTPRSDLTCFPGILSFHLDALFLFMHHCPHELGDFRSAEHEFCCRVHSLSAILLCTELRPDSRFLWTEVSLNYVRMFHLLFLLFLFIHLISYFCTSLMFGSLRTAHTV